MILVCRLFKRDVLQTTVTQNGTDLAYAQFFYVYRSQNRGVKS